MRKMNILKKISYPLGGFSQGIYAAFTNAVLPLLLSLYTVNTVLIGVLVTAATFEGAIAPLIIGPVSDRFRSTLGRRKPFLVAGTMGTAFFLLLLPFARELPLLAVVILLAGLARSITIAPHMAMLSQNSTLTSRSSMASLVSIFGLCGQVVLTIILALFWTTLSTTFIVILVALLFVIPTFVTILWSKDESGEPKAQMPVNFRIYFTQQNRNRYLASQLFLWFGLNMVVPFFTLFLREYLAFPPGKAIFLYMAVVAASGVFAYPFVLLGKKIGELKAFRLGLVAFTAAALIGVFAKGMPDFFIFVLAILAGAGNAAGMVYSFALLTKLTREEQMGLTSGIYAFVTAGSAPIAAAASGLVISLFGYPAMFIGLAIATVGSFLLL